MNLQNSVYGSTQLSVRLSGGLRRKCVVTVEKRNAEDNSNGQQHSYNGLLLATSIDYYQLGGGTEL